MIVLATTGCQVSTTTSSSSSPYMGNWEITVAGDIVGSKVSTIDSNGNFSFSVYVTSTYGSYTSIISGSVEATGKVSGFSYYGISKSGIISGTMISSNSGSGTYTALPGYVGSGTWTMIKQ
jgi:hypothetical protein